MRAVFKKANQDRVKYLLIKIKIKMCLCHLSHNEGCVSRLIYYVAWPGLVMVLILHSTKAGLLIVKFPSFWHQDNHVQKTCTPNIACQIKKWFLNKGVNVEILCSLHSPKNSYSSVLTDHAALPTV